MIKKVVKKRSFECSERLMLVLAGVRHKLKE